MDGVSRKNLWKIIIFILIVIFLIVDIFFVAKIFIFKTGSNNSNSDKFETDTLFLKTLVDIDGTAANNINITNVDRVRHNFSVDLRGIKELASLSENKFELASLEEKTVVVKYNPHGQTPGAYLGRLDIVSDGVIKEIPIILEIQSGNVLFGSNINLSAQSLDPIVGENLNIGIKLFDIAGIGSSHVSVSYFIKDFDGNTVFSDSENLTINKELDYSRSFNVSSGLKPSNYVFIVLVKYKNSVGVSGVYFKIFNKQVEVSSLNSVFSFIYPIAQQKAILSNKYIKLIILFVLCIITAVLLVLFLGSYRKKMRIKALKDSLKSSTLNPRI
jgi:hypothetical protein